MKNLREIVYKTLVKNHGVEPQMFSRIENDDPIAIELVNGEEIFINLNDNAVQAFIEIPIKYRQVLLTQSSKIIEALLLDEHIYLNMKKDKILLACELDANNSGVEGALAEKLNLFNKVAHLARR